MAKQKRKPSDPENYAPNLIGENIRKLRAMRKWSQTKLGKEINTSRSNVSNMERTGAVTADMKEAISKLFKVSRHALENEDIIIHMSEPDNYIEPKELRVTLTDMADTCTEVNNKLDDLIKLTHMIARRIDIPTDGKA
ncbi:helix-turn-helix domain-containing protein [Chitinophagaceae bacterium MMS25-I14]